MAQLAGNIGVTVGTTSTSPILASNSNRAEVRLCNDGGTVIYLAFGQAAVVGGGIRLNARGGFIDTNTKLDIYAISSASGGRVSGSWTESP